jgi:hypothetical protein
VHFRTYINNLALVFSNDGPMPILPGFNALARMRKEELPDIFVGTTGLISQGESSLYTRKVTYT